MKIRHVPEDAASVVGRLFRDYVVHGGIHVRSRSFRPFLEVRKVILAAILGAVGAFALSSSAVAQDPFSGFPEAPRVQTHDEVGVDLRSGEYPVRSSHRAIGPKDATVLQVTINPLTRSSDRSTPRFSRVDLICPFISDSQGGNGGYSCGWEYRLYRLGHEIVVFQVDPFSPYASHVLRDGSLVVDSDEYIVVYRSNGTIWRFKKVLNFNVGGATNAEPRTYAWLESIVSPDGAELVYDGTGVWSSYGYRWQYSPSNTHPLLNLSSSYCPTGAASCAGIEILSRVDAIGVLQIQGNGSFAEVRNVSVTSAEGVVIDLTQELIGAVSPIMTGSIFSAYCGGLHGMRTRTLNNQAGVWTYSHTAKWVGGGEHWYCTDVNSKSIDPNGGVLTVSGDPGHINVTDRLGRLTQYVTEVWNGTKYEDYAPTETGKILSVVYPEGNRADYEYVRNNLSKVTETPKAGGGTARVTFQASYPSDCSETTMKVCNKPIYTIDARGGRTDYSYHGPSGMVETVTGPAGPDGVRPQSRSTYQQLEARILNAAGQLVPTGRPIWKLVSISQCRTQASCANTADETIKTYTYNDNLLPITETTRVGDNSIASVTVGKTYDPVGNLIATDGPLPGTADTTYFRYNAYRELVATISPDPDGTGPLPRAVERNVYNLDGQPIRVEAGTAQTADASDFVLSRFKRMTYDPATGRLMKVEELLP